MPQFSKFRPAVQLLLCIILSHRWLQTTSILANAAITLCLYTTLSIFVIYPYHLFIYLPYLSPLRHLPCPPPGLNTYKTWLGKEPTPPQLLEWLQATESAHSDDFRGLMRYYGIGGTERVLVSGTSALKDVLVTKQYKFFDRPTMARKRIAVQAGNGLIASAGDIHKSQKRKLSPAFAAGAIKDLHPLFWAKANELVVSLNKKITATGSGVIEILAWTSRSALDIIGVAAWGKDFDAISKPDSPFLKSYNAMFDISAGGPLINALALAIPMSALLYIPVPYNNRLREALKAVRERCVSVVREKKAEDKEEGKDILSLLMKGGIEDETALVEQMMTILAAGHDTSSLSLAWGLYLLCRHPDVQTKLRDEIRENLHPGNEGVEKGVSPDQIEGLPYLNAVASEILRLFPSVHTMRREALQDTTIEGYDIPKGSHMVISGWVCNRLKSEWGFDAENFSPDRWLHADSDEKTGVNNKFAFHSFSHGARSCIGQGFARGEFLVFLAALVGCFRFELENADLEPVTLFGITMSPAGGIRMKLSRVE